MSAGLPSDEVAEDYRNALEDLVSNDRYQIANLTMIAKENIEHAEAISRVLTNHINRVSPPMRKLPALYVLDSLVKNIGSPYTVYFGRNLHQTFMLAYSQVNDMVRRKLEEMLKTWREPVPGSLSTTSVFPLSSTNSIYEAIGRFRGSSTTSTNQRQTPVQNFRTATVPTSQAYRNTPTPPQALPLYGQYSVTSHSEAATPQPPPNYNQYPAQTHTPVYPPASTPQWQSSTPQPQPSYLAQLPQRPPSSSSVDLPRLHADIDDLTTDAKIECATHPMNADAQRKLTTLQTLKEILDSGSASEQDLHDIASTIMQEMAKKLALKHQPPPQTSTPQLPQMAPQIQYMPSQPPAQPAYQQPPPPAIPSFINTTNLAELLRATANAQSTPQPSYPVSYAPPVSAYGTPPVVHATPAIVNGPPQVPPPAIPAAALPLLEQLRASGLLSATPTPPQGITPPGAYTAFLPPPGSIEVQFTSASIKIPRPHLVTTFLNARPNQCSTCGKRFTSDDIGKEKKTRHLDWHFKTKARMIEAEKRGQNRSWYVDEREWIASKEFEDDAGLLDEQNTANGTSPNAKKKKQDYVRAPSDPVLRNMPCPIDQESFKSEWSEEVQDFIWKDAIKVGNRYYHASCYREATKDRGNDTGGGTPLGAGLARTSTPDSVLGKRKAEREMDAGTKSRIKLEA